MVFDFNIGDAIEIKRGDKKYRTIVERQISDDTILIYTPIEKGRVLLVSEKEIIEVVFVVLDSKKGKYDVYSFSSIVSGRELRDRIPMLRLQAIGNVKKIQRRDFYRLNIVKPLLIEKLEGEGSVEIITKDISAGGLMAVSPMQLKKDDEYLVYVNIFAEAPVVLSARVLSCDPYNDGVGRFLVRFFFTNIDKKVQSDMIRQINQMQVMELRRRKYYSPSYGDALKSHIDDELLDQFNVDSAFDRRLTYLSAANILLSLVIVVLFLMTRPDSHWFPIFGSEQTSELNMNALRFNLFSSSLLFILSGIGIALERAHYQGRRSVNKLYIFFLLFAIISLLILVTIITSFV